MYKYVQFFFSAAACILLCSVNSYAYIFLIDSEEEDTLTFYPLIVSVSDTSSLDYEQQLLTDTATFISIVNEQKKKFCIG